MKPLFLSLILFALVLGCASSNNKEEPESYPHLVSLEQPGDHPTKSSTVYIDSVKQITADDQPALLIGGTLPDACTKLKSVTHNTRNDSLFIDISAWRNPDTMCAQVLTPFSYIYPDITPDVLSKHSSVTINKSSYNY